MAPAMLRAEMKLHALFSDGAVLQRGLAVPDVNLFNKVGLPATPFRTDMK
jgi:hypothetical protein